VGTGSAAPEVGARVLAPDNGSVWWEGTIDQVDGTIYTVKFNADDKIVARPLTNIAPYPAGALAVEVGDAVVGEWTSGTFYAGTVAAISGNLATVAWDDGSAPSEVATNRLTKTFK